MVATRRAAAAAAVKEETGSAGAANATETVVEQEDRVVEDSGLKVLPLGGEEKSLQGRPQYESESCESKTEIKNEDEYLIEEEEAVITAPEEKEEEMIDVEGMEDDPPFTVQFSSLHGGAAQKIEVKEEMLSLVEETPKKKVKETKVGRGQKKEAANEKKKRPMRGDNEDFMQTGNTPRSKGKKAKPDPNKPLIIDGVPVNPLAEPAVANAYGYDPAKDIVPLGQGQLKSAYRRGKAQLDTPQMDAKRYKLEVKHDHLLDDNDHDDTHRDDRAEGGESLGPSTPHGGMEIMEGVNVYTGDHSISGPSPSPGGSSGHSHLTPHTLHQRSASFTRRPSQPQAAPLIPHAPSPLAGRRISSAATDGWAAMSSSGRRRSDGADRRPSGGRSPPRKMSHYSSGEVPPLTPSTPSTSSTTPVSAPVTTPTAPSPVTPKPTRLSQAEQFTMAAPKVIEAPRLATPLVTTTPSNSDTSLIAISQSMSGDEPLPADVFCAQMERVIADLERANAVLASSSNNGN